MPKQYFYLRRFSSGFSLIELIIALAIISVLIAMAISGYRELVVRQTPLAVKLSLLNDSNLLEQHYNKYGSYFEHKTQNYPNIINSKIVDKEGNEVYTVKFASHNASAHTYYLIATPVEDKQDIYEVMCINQDGIINNGVENCYE